MQSIWDEQTIKPNEIVLVEDGKLIDELYEIIGAWKSKLEGTLKIVSLDENIGTGGAKKVGVENCNYDFIAVMDTDDISTPQRYQKQLEFLKRNPEIDVV
jgi:glycosyltransferase involved in cell wall biosynthesis